MSRQHAAFAFYLFFDDEVNLDYRKAGEKIGVGQAMAVAYFMHDKIQQYFKTYSRAQQKVRAAIAESVLFELAEGENVAPGVRRQAAENIVKIEQNRPIDNDDREDNISRKSLKSLAKSVAEQMKMIDVTPARKALSDQADSTKGQNGGTNEAIIAYAILDREKTDNNNVKSKS